MICSPISIQHSRPCGFPPLGLVARRLLWLLVFIFAILSAPASTAGSISLSNLTQTYNGTARSATVTTVPSGLPHTITYNGSTTAPVNAGSYAVVATLVDEPVSATGTLVINKANLSISFPSLAEKNYGNPPYTISATVNPTASGLAASFACSNPEVATVSGNTVTIVGAGTTTITASQAGNANYNPAPDVNRTLTVIGLPQTVTLSPLPAVNQYGDAPFSVSGSSSTGLPVSFRSSDPTVATVSGNTVTMVGAGHCSIIAEQAGNSVYAYASMARPLIVAPGDLPMPPPAISTIYDGSPKAIDPVTLPSGAATQIRYRLADQTAPDPVPQLAFQNGPNTLANSYSSIGLQANGYWSMGKSIGLAGTARKLHSCDVTLVTWAQYNTVVNYGYLNWANDNPGLVVPPPDINNMTPGNTGGWYHPITLAIYDYDDDAQTWKCLAEKTVTTLIPWRPMKLANGNNYTNNGYAFRVPFTFPDGIILPDDVFVSVGFNTNTHGRQPIKAAGPYEALNVAHPGSVSAGTDYYPGYIFYEKDWDWWSPNSLGGPMLRLWTVPTNETQTPPVNVGTYEVKTIPTGKGVPLVPAIASLTISYDFAGWTETEIAAGRLPAGQSGDSDDPDKDGFTNLQEYAFNLNPGAPDTALPGHPARLSFLPPHLGFTYRRNLQAVDLTYLIEGTGNLSDPESWNPLVPLFESTVADDGATRVIEATVPKPSDTPGYFLRLKVSRNPVP